MRYAFSIYVPSTTDIDQLTDNTRYVRRVVKLLSMYFGGASYERINGAWYSDTLNTLVTEDVTRVWAYGETNTDHDRRYVKAIANAIKTWMLQESVAFEILAYPESCGLQFT